MLSPEGGGCGLHVLYITDICHAGMSNSNPCETFLPSDQARQRQEVQKEASSHAGLRGPPFPKGQSRGGEPHAGLFSYLIKTQM